MTPDEIRAIREASGMTQSEFAERIGVHRVSFSKWERGRCVPDPIYVANMILFRDRGVSVMDVLRSNPRPIEEVTA